MRSWATEAGLTRERKAASDAIGVGRPKPFKRSAAGNPALRLRWLVLGYRARGNL